ncbi:MAG: cellulose-binding protein [Dactylosporangium sp.]|nr:hypothetical protein [Dactylosporangium sp.]NNJ62509.1 cellulose-binding protein [Dactylosporangium sp.]
MRSRHRWTRRRWRHDIGWTDLAVGSVSVLVAAAIWVAVHPASASALTASVTVDAGRVLATFPDTAIGANLAVGDGLLADSRTGPLLKDAGIGYLRYPGGAAADRYHWETHTTDGSGQAAPDAGFDAFMGMVRAAGAQPIIVANYGSGTAAEAAGWVTYANVTKGYNVTYWEIGNEVYHNGHYGSGRENDIHADKSPHAYATNFLEYAGAMKAVDPSIKIGVVLTTPGTWPDGAVAARDPADWNDTVLSIVGDTADFATFHFYPGGSDEADMLTKPQALASIIEAFRADLARWDVGSMPVFITEVNGGPPHDAQAQALWAADLYLAAAEAGVANIDWWSVHSGAGPLTTDVTGATDYGDEGLLSNGSGSEPAAQTPFRTYYGIQLASHVAASGDDLVTATSDQARLSAHAVRRAGGGLDVLLINKDPEQAYTVNLSYRGFAPASDVTVERFPLGAGAISTDSDGTASEQTISPYAMVAVHLEPSDHTKRSTSNS